MASVLGSATVNRGSIVGGRIWFIEYSLRPKPKMVIIPRQHVFYDNIGGRYVEVCTFHNKFDKNRGHRNTEMTFDDIASYNTLNPAGEFPKLYEFVRQDISSRIWDDWCSQNRGMGSWLHNDQREYAKLGILAYLPPGSPDHDYDPVRDARKLKIRHYGNATTLKHHWVTHI
ncbi:hypothetical protein QBC45DRAFT_467559 [Copromyces sp. CBS 386.78]|nr:hypothetical protein QBC45DRAFT_467559 [Copromyces sp. CBS 386.78]